jgi:4-amino-4-deoxy-L-arabinose transferase-like glycosyltransferase
MKERMIERSRETLPFVVAIIGAAIILLVTLLLPLGFDNDLYESMGWTLYAYHGLPYIASWDHNFPGIVFVHWASIALFGASDFGFRLFDYFVHIAMAGFFYRVLRTWLSPRTSALAAIIFALYYASGQWGLAGQRDTYAAFLLLGAVFAFVKLRTNKKHTSLFAMIIGVVCGATFLMRPTYVFFAFAFLILLFGLPNKFKTIIYYLAGCVLPIIAFLLPYVFVPDGLTRVYNTLIRFNLDVYSSVHVPINLWSRGRVPIFLSAAVGLFLAFRHKLAETGRQDRTMFLLLAGCALLSPIMMGKYFTYHFEPFMLLAIPFAALGLNCLADLIPIRFLANACLFFALALFFYAYYPRHLIKYYFDAQGSSVSRLEATYEQVLSDSLYGLAAQRQVVQYVDCVSAPQDPIEYVSIFPGLRWRLQRPSATHFTSVVPLAAYSKTVPSYGAAWRREFLQSLEQVSPHIIVVSKSNQWWPFVGKTNDSAITCIPGFDSLLSANYTLDTMIRGYSLYRIRK